MLATSPLESPAIEVEYLSLRVLSTYSNLSIRTLRGYLSHRARPLPHYRVGGKVLVKRSEFDAWVTGFREDAHRRWMRSSTMCSVGCRMRRL